MAKEVNQIEENVKAQNEQINKTTKELYEKYLKPIHITLEDKEKGIAVIKDGVVIIPFKNGMPIQNEQTGEITTIVLGAVDGDFIEDCVPACEKQAKLQRKQQKIAQMQAKQPQPKLSKKDSEG